MSAEFHVSVSAATLAKLREIAARRGCSMAAVVRQIADDIGTFEWRGAVRDSRPMTAREVAYRCRGAGEPRPGARYTIWVEPTVHTKLAKIAGRRGLTMPRALALVCADVIGRRA